MNSYYCSQRILLVMTGLLCLLGQGLGAVIPPGGGRGDISIDAIIHKENSISASEVQDFITKNHWILDDDMVLTTEQYDELHPTGKRRKRTLAISPGDSAIYWPNGIVHYSFKVLQFGLLELNGDDRNRVRKAMQEISHYTCVTFVENDNAKYRVVISNDTSSCFSSVGMVSGKQLLALSKHCMSQPGILHELGHSLGLYHEQSRPDRDQYITIHFENIEERNTHNFDIHPSTYTTTFNLPYDYLSVMHYGPSAFAKQYGLTSIEARDRAYKDIMGNVQSLSLLDIRVINLMYQCASCPLKDSDCAQYHAEAFVGKDCKCWCPGPAPFKAKPVEYCLQSDIDKFGSLDFDYCEDKSDSCYYYSRGLCVEERERMATKCAKTCKFC